QARGPALDVQRPQQPARRSQDVRGLPRRGSDRGEPRSLRGARAPQPAHHRGLSEGTRTEILSDTDGPAISHGVVEYEGAAGTTLPPVGGEGRSASLSEA